MKDIFRRKPHPKQFDKNETRGRERTTEESWYTPTVEDVLAQVRVAQTMLNRIPDANLALAKREMYILEDMMWQLSEKGEAACKG